MARVPLGTEERTSSGREVKEMSEIINLICLFATNLLIGGLFIIMLNPPYHHKGIKSWVKSFLEEE